MAERIAQRSGDVLIGRDLPASKWRAVLGAKFGGGKRAKCVRLESLANSQSECVTVPALGDIGSKVDVVFLAELKTQPPASAGQELAILRSL